MKIIMCTRDMKEGSGTHIKMLLKKFDKMNEIEKMLVIGPKKMDGFSPKTQFEILKPRGRYFVSKQPFFAIECRRKIENALEKEKYDLIHTHHSFIAKFFGIPLISTFHILQSGYFARIDSSTSNYKLKIGELFHRIYEIFDINTIDHSSKVIFVSKTSLERAKSRYKKHSHKFVFVPNFIDTTMFSPLKKNSLRERYGLSQDKKYVLFVGRLEPLKGIELLIAVIKELRKKVNLELLVVGKGMLAKKIKSCDFVNYLGRIPNEKMNEIYNIADLFVLPSYYENCPLTVLEAMASGCLVLASDVGDVREMVNNEQLIFGSGNKQEIKEKIIGLLNLNQEEKNEIIQFLIQRTKSDYNVKIIAKRILDLYENIREK